VHEGGGSRSAAVRAAAGRRPSTGGSVAAGSRSRVVAVMMRNTHIERERCACGMRARERGWPKFLMGPMFLGR
jgi:hypothetical protein